ncbi:retrovirus-related pol polyprotein from transposon TNT 1-94 [Tanacetum coccineum]
MPNAFTMCCKTKSASAPEIVHEIVEEARIDKPLDNAIESARLYTKRSQELLEYVLSIVERIQLTRGVNHVHQRLAGQRLGSLKRTIGSCQVVQIVLLYLDSGCSNHRTVESLRINTSLKKFIWDCQFCDSDLEVAFRKHSCYARDVDGVELLQGSRGSNLYTISVEDMMKSSPICLLSKASKNKSWLWHHRLNHLNFDTINDLARKDMVRGLPRTPQQTAVVGKAESCPWEAVMAQLDIIKSYNELVPNLGSLQLLMSPQLIKRTSALQFLQVSVVLAAYTSISHQGFAAGPTIEANPFAQVERQIPCKRVCFAPENLVLKESSNKGWLVQLIQFKLFNT